MKLRHSVEQRIIIYSCANARPNMAMSSKMFLWKRINVLLLSRRNVTVANPDPEVRFSGTVHPLDLTGSGIVFNEYKGECVEVIKYGDVYCVC